MTLSPEAVDAYKKLLTDPKENGLDFPPLKEVFEDAEVATPKHILFEQYIKIINKPLPKLMFYIIMDGMYKQAHAPDGNLGYLIKVNDNITLSSSSL